MKITPSETTLFDKYTKIEIEPGDTREIVEDCFKLLLSHLTCKNIIVMAVLPAGRYKSGDAATEYYDLLVGSLAGLQALVIIAKFPTLESIFDKKYLLGRIGRVGGKTALIIEESLATESKLRKILQTIYEVRPKVNFAALVTYTHPEFYVLKRGR